MGIDTIFVQDNMSYSAQKGTLRGLHYQRAPYSQAKLVRCTKGTVIDVAVDIRKGSPTYGKWVSCELSDENIEAIRYFQKEGGLFTLATGRYPKYVNRFKDQFDPNTYLVMGNGTMLLAPVKAEGIEKGQFSPSYEEPVLIREIVFPKTPREEVLFMVEECGCEVMFTDLRNRS